MRLPASPSLVCRPEFLNPIQCPARLDLPPSKSIRVHDLFGPRSKPAVSNTVSNVSSGRLTLPDLIDQLAALVALLLDGRH
jgi:hypothetical protein